MSEFRDAVAEMVKGNAVDQEVSPLGSDAPVMDEKEQDELKEI